MKKSQTKSTDDIIRIFIRNWTYCWEQGERTTALDQYGQTQPIDYGFVMGDRRYEFFVWGEYISEAILTTLNRYQEPFYVSYFSDKRIPRAIIKDFHFITTDYLMIADLNIIEPMTKSVHRITRINEANHVNLQLFHIKKSERLKMIKPDRLDDPHLRFYYVETEHGNVAASGSYSLIDGVVLLDNIYTDPQYRRKGYGETLCRKMLFDAQMEGAEMSIIASSMEGRSMYKRIGFKDVQKVQIYGSHLSH